MSGPSALSRSTTGILKQVILFLAAASLVALLTACGGGEEDQPSVRLLLEADLSGLPSRASPDTAMDALLDVLRIRAVTFGFSDADITRDDSSRVSVTLPGEISEEDARQLMVKTALLELRQPILDENGDIVCQSPEDVRFSVSTEGITYTSESPDDRPAPRCLGGGGQSGEIVWEPAATTDGQNQSQDAGPVILRPLSAVVDRTRAPVVLITLVPDDSELLQATSARLVGLPLGFFLDGEILAGPTIQEPLTTDNIPIAGLSLKEANLLAAQLNGGALPLPLKEVTTEASSE